jgi:hypothetical protein
MRSKAKRRAIWSAAGSASAAGPWTPPRSRSSSSG